MSKHSTYFDQFDSDSDDEMDDITNELVNRDLIKRDNSKSCSTNAKTMMTFKKPQLSFDDPIENQLKIVSNSKHYNSSINVCSNDTDDTENSIIEKKKSITLMCEEFKGRKEKRTNTTNTYKISNTIDVPNIKLLIKSVASLIHISLRDDASNTTQIDRESDMWNFSEEKYIEEYPELFDDDRIELLSSEPTVADISEFIENLFEIIEFSSECAVVSIIYIHRLKKNTKIPILPLTWRPLVLVAIQLAQKVWDDKSINNETLTQVYPFFDIKTFNMLEQIFIGSIDFNTHVKFSLYTTYFLELKALVFDLAPIDEDHIKKLEDKTLLKENILKFQQKGLKIKRHKSF